MSCDTNKITLVDANLEHRARHRRDDDDDNRHGLWLFKALHDGEAHRDIIKEVLEAKFAGVRETVEAKADVLKAIADTAGEVKEAKHDLVVKILESRADEERGKREQLRDLFDLIGRRRRCGCDND